MRDEQIRRILNQIKKLPEESYGDILWFVEHVEDAQKIVGKLPATTEELNRIVRESIENGYIMAGLLAALRQSQCKESKHM